MFKLYPKPTREINLQTGEMLSYRQIANEKPLKANLQ